MAVEQITGTVCAGWTYVDERGEASWLIVVRSDAGEWIQLDDSGISYDQSAGRLRGFIDDWMNDAAIDNGESTPWPCPDIAEVYRAAADFIEQADSELWTGAG
jgi:hypothetical protein